MSQTILYARVSTADQTAAHQQTQAEAAGFTVDTAVSNGGVSRRARSDSTTHRS